MTGVKFLIGQVGTSKEAVDFLNTLRGNDAIAKVSHVFAGMMIFLRRLRIVNSDNLQAGSTTCTSRIVTSERWIDG
jgi:hypothetical protein